MLTQRALKLLAMQAVQLRKKISREKSLARDVYYFGYGANLDLKRFEKYSMNVEGVGVASLNHYELTFSLPCEYKGKGFASADPKKDKEVWGYLYRMDRLSLLLLDIMEWAMFNHYHRVEVMVKTKEGIEHKAFTYLAKYPKEGLVPSTQYKNTILRSAKKHGFPLEYIQEIEKVSSKERFELDPGHRLMFPNKRRILEKRLRRLYLSHDKLRERICNWLTF